MIKLSFSSLGAPQMPLEEFLALLGQSDYDAVELRGRPGAHVHHEDSPERRKEVCKMLADNGLEAASVTTYIFAANRDPGGTERPDHRDEAGSIEELKRFVDLASDIGAKNVRVFGGHLTEGETHQDALPRVARIMAAGADVNPDISICLELHDVWNTSELVARVLDQADRPNCKALWDIGHVSLGGEAPDEVIERLRPERIAYLHVKDMVELPGWEKPYHCLIGAGTAPIQIILKLLKSVGWDGYANVEWESVYNKYMPDADVAVPQSAVKLREWLAD